MNSFISPIKIARQKEKLTIKNLSCLSKVPEKTIRQIERGLLVTNNDEIDKICRTLNIPNKCYTNNNSIVTPGEGYVTSKAASGTITPRTIKDIPTDKIKIFDLFCGAGGLSCGFEQTGKFITIGGIDLLNDRIKTFTENHPYANGIAGNILNYSLDDISSLIGQPDIIVGGPPCQGFSSIRPFRTLTEDDPRNNLVEEYVLVINRVQPKWFVFENVIGLLNHKNGNKFSALIKGLQSIGYSLSWKVVNAAVFGVPQYRERLMIVGNRLNISFDWPKPTHWIHYKSMAGQNADLLYKESDFNNKLLPPVTIMEAIGDLPIVSSGEEANLYSTAPETDYEKYIRNGCNNLNLHKSTKHSEKMLEIIRHAGANIYALPKGMVKSGFSSCYSRLEPDRPSNTLTVNFTNPSSNKCIHPFQNRALTLREGARIQSFPDTYKFFGTTSQIAKQIGNAVPPLVGKKIAEQIYTYFL